MLEIQVKGQPQESHCSRVWNPRRSDVMPVIFIIRHMLPQSYLQGCMDGGQAAHSPTHMDCCIHYRCRISWLTKKWLDIPDKAALWLINKRSKKGGQTLLLSSDWPAWTQTLPALHAPGIWTLGGFQSGKSSGYLVLQELGPSEHALNHDIYWTNYTGEQLAYKLCNPTSFMGQSVDCSRIACKRGQILLSSLVQTG